MAPDTDPGAGLHAVTIDSADSDGKTAFIAELAEQHVNGLRFAPNVDLESVSLAGLMLDRSEMPSAVLRKSKLRGAKLNQSNLRDADLAGADLRDAELAKADLRGAMFEDADLRNANLRFSNLQGAIFESANLEETDFWGSNLDEVALTNANLRSAVLTETSLRGADLTGADMENVTMNRSKMDGAKLNGVDLSGADLRGSSLRGASLAGSRLQHVDLLSCDLTHAYLADAWMERTQCSLEQFGGMIGEEKAGDVIGAEKGYLALERNFEGLGDSRAASWAYRRRRRMGKRSAKLKGKRFARAHQWRESMGWFARYAGDQCTEWLCDYGESIPRVLVCILCMYLLFMGLYKVNGSVVHVYQSATGIARVRTGNLGDLAIFTLLAMTSSSGPGVGLQPASESVYLLTGIQTILGIGLTGLLGFVVGNRIRR